MKKVFALLLTLMMLTAGLAAAETLELVPGTPENCPFTTFKTYFDMIAQQSGYTFTWADEPAAENGYEVYSAVSADDAMVIKVYVLDGNVCYTDGEGAVTLNMTDASSAQKFGEWFGVALSNSAICMRIAGGDTAFLSDSNFASSLQADVQPLVSILMNDFNEDTLSKGKAATSTVAGYPAGLEISGSIVDNTSVSLTMRTVVGCPGSEISVK